MLPGTDRPQVLMPSGGGPPGMIGYRTTRYARCVTPSVSVSPVCSSSIRCGSRSNRLRPPPSRTLTRWIRISSTRPAARNCWSTLAPMSPMPLSPATSWAFASALSIPSVTKVNTGSALVVTHRPPTKHGTTSPNGPLPPPGLDRVVVTSAAHDHRARFLDQVAVHPLEHRRVVERPVVESHPVLAQPLLGVVVGRRDVAVQRHAHVDDHVAHLRRLLSGLWSSSDLPGSSRSSTLGNPLWLRQQPGASRGQRRRAGPEEGEKPSPAHPGRREFDGHVAVHLSFVPPTPAIPCTKVSKVGLLLPYCRRLFCWWLRLSTRSTVNKVSRRADQNR